MAERESSKSQAALAAYLELGPARSLAKLAQYPEKFGMSSVSVRHLEQWSSRYKWREQANRFDERQRAEQRREHEQALKEMRMRQIRQSLAQQELSHQVIMDKLAQPKASLYAASQIYKNASDQERALLDDTDKDMIIDELKELAKKRGIKYE